MIFSLSGGEHPVEGMEFESDAGWGRCRW